MPRFSAVWITTLGLSTWHVITSTPWSIRLLVASPSLVGIDQSPVKITWQVTAGFAFLAPRAKALIFRKTCGIGLAATKPIFLLLVIWPATMPDRYWHSSM